jgi:hypothetical protein
MSEAKKLIWIICGWSIIPLVLIWLIPDLAYIPIIGTIIVFLYTTPVHILQNLTSIDLIHGTDSSVYFSLLGATVTVILWIIILGVLFLFSYKRNLK